MYMFMSTPTSYILACRKSIDTTPHANALVCDTNRGILCAYIRTNLCSEHNPLLCISEQLPHHITKHSQLLACITRYMYVSTHCINYK